MNSPPKTSTKRITSDSKGFAGWTQAAYEIARKSITAVPARECMPVDRSIPLLVGRTLERLDVLDELFSGPEKTLRTELANTRLFVAALSYVHVLCGAADALPREFDALCTRALSMRDGLRHEEAEIVASGILIEGYRSVRARSDSARDLGRELLALVKRGHETGGFGNHDEARMARRLFEAQVVAERLLTEVGDRDAPTLERVVRGERIRGYALYVQYWSALRDGVRCVLGDAKQADELVPPIYVGDA